MRYRQSIMPAVQSPALPKRRSRTGRTLLVLLTPLLSAALLVSAGAAGGIEITNPYSDAQGEHWSYDAGNTTLTLNGGTWDYIYAPSTDLTLVLNGENNITGGNIVTFAEVPYRYGVYLGNGNLTILSDDSDNFLYVHVQDTVNETYGIWAAQNIVINGAVAVYANATENNAYGIYAYNNDITISDGTVVAEVWAFSDSFANAYGLYANEDIIISNAEIPSIFVEASGAGYGNAYGIYSYSGSVSVSGDDVWSDAVSTGCVEATAYGIYAEDAVTISEGNVTYC